MSCVDPQGCQVFSFKQPRAEELEHDSLWRTARRLPERGRIGISNRSCYEEVLIVRCIRSFSALEVCRLSLLTRMTRAVLTSMTQGPETESVHSTMSVSVISEASADGASE